MKILKTKKIFTYLVVVALVSALSIIGNNEGTTGSGDDTGNNDNAKLITKTEIETIMKTVKFRAYLLGDTPNIGEIIIGMEEIIKFSFANESFSSSAPNFSSTGTTINTTSAALAIVNVYASAVAKMLEYAINVNSKFGEYFTEVETSTTPQINSSKKECTFTIKFKQVKSGYALSSEVAHLMTTGLTIKLILDSKATWYP